MAAILNALKNHGGSVKGSTLYCTLIPNHKDSQMIRDVKWASQEWCTGMTSFLSILSPLHPRGSLMDSTGGK